MKSFTLYCLSLFLISVIAVSCNKSRSSTTEEITATENADFSISERKLLNEYINERKTDTTVLMLANNSDFDGIENYITSSSGTINYSNRDFSYISANLSPERVLELPREFKFKKISLNNKYKLDPMEFSRTNVFTEYINDINSRGVFDGSDDYFPFLATSEIQATKFIKETGYNGKGIKVAILDTGISLGHPGLSTTINGTQKIIDWMDFTEDGRANLKQAQLVNEKAVQNEYGTLIIENLRSDDNNYYMGEISEEKIKKNKQDSAHEKYLTDLNLNGQTSDKFKICVFKKEGKYIGYVDTNLNDNITDEKQIGNYKDTYEALTMDKHGLIKLAFITYLDSNGNIQDASLGFDSNSHGTHVAGILAGHNLFSSKIDGAAPGAELLSIKVIDTETDDNTIIKAMIYAIQQKADIINLSLGGRGGPNAGSSTLNKFIDMASEKYNVLVVIAAGNDGPGINSLETPGDSKNSITVGAYISSKTLDSNYGVHKTNGEYVMYFSSIGPRLDGFLKPDIVAPGSALSSVPLWLGGYNILQGTSMTAPMVSGGLALLLEGAKSENISYDYYTIKEALVSSSRELKEKSGIEQGYGLMQVKDAFFKLKKLHGRNFYYDVNLASINKDVKIAKGLYARGFIPSQQIFRIKKTFYKNANPVDINQSTSTYKITSDVNWIKTRREFYLVGDKESNLVTDYDLAKARPGLYFGRIFGTNEADFSDSFIIPNTIIIPYLFLDENKYQVEIKDKGDLNSIKRFFFKVPQNTNALNINLNLNREGTVKIFITQPNGMAYSDKKIASFIRKGVDLAINQPTYGIWEVDVFTPPTFKSEFSLKTSVLGIVSSKEEIKFYDVKEGGAFKTNLSIENIYSSAYISQVAELEGIQASERIQFIGNNPITREVSLSSDTYRLEIRTNEPGFDEQDVDVIVLDSFDNIVGVSTNAGSYEFIGVDTSNQTGNFKVIFIPYAEEGSFKFNWKLFERFPFTKFSINGANTIRNTEESFNIELTMENPPHAPSAPYQYFGSLYFYNTETKEFLRIIPITLFYN
jgi:subtilisin family serine protease